ncbi:Leucine-rich repeat-containing protein 16B [Liparis tanakae]|uniref:Leucine-rich repeat-containing protein 16B n=1 Tax=Liparis tanakae TaxID=230148 RepID=A0A4Z2EPU7_9TELE|nr:Leucine-rich repeat-containing protein 16B [Liparis tanakae]
MKKRRNDRMQRREFEKANGEKAQKPKCGHELEQELWRDGEAQCMHGVLATWRLYLFAVKVPTKMEVTFNFLEIRAMNTYPEHQVVIDTDKTTYSLRLQTQDQLDHMVKHINSALSRVFNNSIYARCRVHALKNRPEVVKVEAWPRSVPWSRGCTGERASQAECIVS